MGRGGLYAAKNSKAGDGGPIPSAPIAFTLMAYFFPGVSPEITQRALVVNSVVFQVPLAVRGRISTW